MSIFLFFIKNTIQIYEIIRWNHELLLGSISLMLIYESSIFVYLFAINSWIFLLLKTNWWNICIPYVCATGCSIWCWLFRKKLHKILSSWAISISCKNILNFVHVWLLWIVACIRSQSTAVFCVYFLKWTMMSTEICFVHNNMPIQLKIQICATQNISNG